MLEHIPSCCPRAVANSYWQHDQVLWTIADTICSTLNISRKTGPIKNTIHFVKEGERPTTQH